MMSGDFESFETVILGKDFYSEARRREESLLLGSGAVVGDFGLRFSWMEKCFLLTYPTTSFGKRPSLPMFCVLTKFYRPMEPIKSESRSLSAKTSLSRPCFLAAFLKILLSLKNSSRKRGFYFLRRSSKDTVCCYWLYSRVAALRSDC